MSHLHAPYVQRFLLSLPCALLALTVAAIAPEATAADRPNVLFIAVDDLRPDFDCYGVGQMVTPNLNRLAQRGIRFDHAYCNIAVCGASRASIMKGLRPTPHSLPVVLDPSRQRCT